MKKKICLVPYGPIETYAIEAWMDEKAGNGWQLQKLYGRFALFETSEPRPTRYRIDVQMSEKYDCETELREAYAAAGWQYVSDLGWNSYCVYRTDDPTAPELHSDSEVFFRAFKRRLCLEWTAIGLALLLLLWLLLRPNGVLALLRGGGLEILLGRGLFDLGGCILYFLFLLVFAVHSIHQVRQAQTNLKAGFAKHMDAAWGRYLIQLLLGLCLAAILVITCASVDYGAKPGCDITAYDAPILPPLWQSMNREEYALAQAEPPADSGIADFVFERRSPFADAIQCVRQYGGFASDETGLTAAERFYNADLYEMKQIRYAEKVFALLMREDGCAAMEAGAGYDAAAYGTQKDAQTLILRAGDSVMYVFYNGNEDLRAYLDLFADALRQEGRP